MSKKKLPFYGHISLDGKITLPKNMRQTMVKAFSGCEVLVTVEQHFEKRTTQQNRLLWGFIYAPIVNHLNSLEPNKWTSEKIHDVCKMMFLKEQQIDMETGEVQFEYLRSTTELSKAEMSDYIESIMVWAIELFNLQLLNPIKELSYE